MGFQLLPISIKEIKNRYGTPYERVIYDFQSTPRSDLKKYVDLYQRLFKNLPKPDIMREEGPFKIFLEDMISTKGKDINFLKDVLKEFPQLFNSTINYSDSFEQRIEEAIEKLNSLPSLLSVKDVNKKGYEAFSS